MTTKTWRVARALMLGVAVTVAGCAPAVSARDIEGARIEGRVKTALVNDPEIGNRVINVRMTGGVAQLSGRVRDQREAERAAEIARSVSGVSAVDLRLRIGDDPPDAVADTLVPADPVRSLAAELAAELAELEDGPGLLAVGAAVGWANQPAPAGTSAAIQPLIKLGSRPGLGAAIAFDWFNQTVGATPAPVGALRLRPVMAGVQYSLPMGRLSVAPSLVAGYSFNSVRVPDQGTAQGLPVDVTNSFVWRPGLTLWIETSRRTSLNLSVGRAFTRPRVTFVEDTALVERSENADTTVLLAGLVYRLF